MGLAGKGKILIVVWLLLLSLAITLPNVRIVRADNSSPYINSLEGTVDIDMNGEASIRQVIDLGQEAPFYWVIRFPRIDDLRVEHDGLLVSKNDYELNKKGQYLLLRVDSKITGRSWKVAFKTKRGISLTTNREMFRWEVFSDIKTYIQRVDITIHSPVAFKDEDISNYRVYAYHGVGKSEAQLIDRQSVRYFGEYLGPESGFTVAMNWPKGTLTLGRWQSIVLDLSNIELIFWLVYGLVLPIIGFFLLILTYWRSRQKLHFNPPRTIGEKLPVDLSPLMTGIILEKKIHPHILLSAILDLCQRGYLIIIKSENRYIFGKRKKIDENLRPWEKELLEEIFAAETVWTEEEDVETRSNKQLFSPKIIDIYEAAYNGVTELGYFTQNPHLVRIRYKIIGILLYLLAIIGVVWAGFAFQSPYLLIPLSGVLLASLVIIRVAPIMPTHSAKGIEALEQWISFRNFLEQKKALPAQYSIGGMYYEYLPYAVAMKVEKQWTRRFRNYRLVMPEWYLTSERTGAEESVKDILAVVENISSSLSHLRGPAVT